MEQIADRSLHTLIAAITYFQVPVISLSSLLRMTLLDKIGLLSEKYLSAPNKECSRSTEI